MIRLVVIAITMIFSTSLYADVVEVVPESYLFDKPTNRGSYEYHDWTGKQLIDGVYGGERYSLDLGNGEAYEWLGWSSKPTINIDFIFENNPFVKINSITVGTTQSRITDVVLPDLKIFSSSNGIDWFFLDEIENPENSDFDNKHVSFSFSDLSISTADYIRVVAEFNSDGPWTFIDEIDFYSEVNLKNSLQVVSEPPITILLLGIAFLFLSRTRMV